MSDQPVATPAMTVGSRLVELCQQGEYEQAAQELYAPSIVSIEGPGGDPEMQKLEGIEAVAKKGAWWAENHEVHGSEVAGPFCGHRDDQFVVQFDMDVTFKPTGERQNLDEIALYTVADGKIVQEEVLYLAG